MIALNLHANKESYDFLQQSSLPQKFIQSPRIWLKLLEIYEDDNML